MPLSFVLLVAWKANLEVGQNRRPMLHVRDDHIVSHLELRRQEVGHGFATAQQPPRSSFSLFICLCWCFYRWCFCRWSFCCCRGILGLFTSCCFIRIPAFSSGISFFLLAVVLGILHTNA